MSTNIGTVATNKYNTGYAAGISGRSIVTYLGAGTSFNVSTYNGYASFTTDNFHVEMNGSFSGEGGTVYNITAYWPGVSMSLTKTYNNSTGVLTCVCNCSAWDHWGHGGASGSTGCKAWLIH